MIADPCGCWDEDVRHRAFGFSNAQPMASRSDFTDNCTHIRHYCELHWAKRNGEPDTTELA